jgi:hypothetical protein
MYSSKIKVIKEVTKQQKSRFFLLYLLDDGMFGSGSVLVTNGSGRPKNIRILRIRIQISNTAKHCFKAPENSR